MVGFSKAVLSPECLVYPLKALVHYTWLWHILIHLNRSRLAEVPSAKGNMYEFCRAAAMSANAGCVKLQFGGERGGGVKKIQIAYLCLLSLDYTYKQGLKTSKWLLRSSLKFCQSFLYMLHYSNRNQV